MAEYTFYKPDGTITVNLDIAPYELEMNLRPGESYIEGRYSGNAYEIKNGEPVLKAVTGNPFMRRAAQTQGAA